MAFPSDVTITGHASVPATGALQPHGVNQPGASNYLNARDTLFLAQYSGEVAKAYEQTLIFGKTVTRFPVRGKSIQLPYFGRARAGFHTSMVNILDPANYLLSTVPGAQRSLYVDKPLVSAFLLDEWDDILNHLPTRQIYSEQAGVAIATTMDNLISRQIVEGAGVAADGIFVGHPGGNSITATSALDGADVVGYALNGATVAPSTAAPGLASAIRRLRVSMDEKFVPMGGRMLAMSPANYQLLCQFKDLFDVDYTPGGNGSYADGEIRSVSGFKIVVTTNGPFAGNLRNMPSDGVMDQDLGGIVTTYQGTGIAGAGATPTIAAITAARTALQTNMSAGNTYSGGASFAKVVAVAWAPRAVAMADARNLKVETDSRIEYGATLVKTSVVSGVTYWQPECCGVIRNTT